MSLAIVTAILIMEYSLWFYSCHNSEYPIDRTKNLIALSFGMAVLAMVYAHSWTLMNQPNLFDITPGVYWFAVVNLIVGSVFSTAFVVSRVRMRHS